PRAVPEGDALYRCGVLAAPARQRARDLLPHLLDQRLLILSRTTRDRLADPHADGVAPRHQEALAGEEAPGLVDGDRNGGRGSWLPAGRKGRSCPTVARVPSGKMTAEARPRRTRPPSSRIAARADGASPRSIRTCTPRRRL